jgi:hypothetical protein
MLFVDVRQQVDISGLLARLAWNPSVALVILDHCQPEWRQRFPTLRTAQLVSPGEETVEPWADAVIVELAADETLTALPNWSRPTIALRRGVSYTGVEEARRACERMQAELAPQSLAGYLVAP